MKYLIACDLDGSLLNHDSEVSIYSKKVLRYLESMGHKVVIATGRPFSGAIDIYKDLGIHNVLITDNGGSIQHPFSSEFKPNKTFIPKAVTDRLFINTRHYLNSAFFSDDTIVYAYQYEPRLKAFFSSLDQREVIEKPLNEFDVEATGIIFLVQTPSVEIFETYMDTSHSDLLSYRLWGKDSKHAIYEIYLKHISKASALKIVANYYNIPHHQVIAFGDGINDIEMIAFANPGVAMKNAVPEIIAVSKDMTLYENHEDGVAHYLYNFFTLDVDLNKET
jgi:Cof subfamily protein (haloacid dehalogenase superfamily)